MTRQEVGPALAHNMDRNDYDKSTDVHHVWNHFMICWSICQAWGICDWPEDGANNKYIYIYFLEPGLHQIARNKDQAQGNALVLAISGH